MTEPVGVLVCVDAGAEKIISRLRPEKPWFTAVGRGFDSRHLHLSGSTPESGCRRLSRTAGPLQGLACG